MKSSDLEMRDAFITNLFCRATQDRNIIFMSSEYGAPSLDRFREELPGQFINAAISEQNLISVAAGMALGGKSVFVYSIASFITLRCCEQIKIDLCCMKLPVTILGVGTGYAYGVDGPTHHATEDISIMRSLANMNIFCPSDSNSAASLVDVALRKSTPLYIRLDKGKYPLLYESGYDAEPGYSVFGDGEDICILSTGTMIHKVLGISDELHKQGIKAQVIDVYRLKPVNAEHILLSIGKRPRVIAVEEHTINGGLGSIMAEILMEAGLMTSFKRFALSDETLYTYGEREKLHCRGRIDQDNIVKTVLEWMP